MLARLRGLTTMLGVSSHNLVNVFGQPSTRCTVRQNTKGFFRARVGVTVSSIFMPMQQGSCNNC